MLPTKRGVLVLVSRSTKTKGYPPTLRAQAPPVTLDLFPAA